MSVRATLQRVRVRDVRLAVSSETVYGAVEIDCVRLLQQLLRDVQTRHLPPSVESRQHCTVKLGSMQHIGQHPGIQRKDLA